MTSPASARTPEGRYGAGQKRTRPGLVAAVVVLATVFVGWVVWAAVGASAPDVSGQVTGFSVRGPHRISVEVTLAGKEGLASCRLRALAGDREVVGVTTVRTDLGASGRSETTVEVRTRARAVTAVLDDCTVPGAG